MLNVAVRFVKRFLCLFCAFSFIIIRRCNHRQCLNFPIMLVSYLTKGFASKGKFKTKEQRKFHCVILKNGKRCVRVHWIDDCLKIWFRHFAKNMDYELYGCSARFRTQTKLTDLANTHRDSVRLLLSTANLVPGKIFHTESIRSKQFRALSGNCCLFICSSITEQQHWVSNNNHGIAESLKTGAQ